MYCTFAGVETRENVTVKTSYIIMVQESKSYTCRGRDYGYKAIISLYSVWSTDCRKVVCGPETRLFNTCIIRGSCTFVSSKSGQ